MSTIQNILKFHSEGGTIELNASVPHREKEWQEMTPEEMASPVKTYVVGEPCYTVNGQAISKEEFNELKRELTNKAKANS